VWVGSSRKDLREFPDAVQDHMGYAPYVVAQQGGKHRDTKTLTGFGVAVVETPRQDIELIKQRLREAERIAKGEKP
jgi:phage-related protein